MASTNNGCEGGFAGSPCGEGNGWPQCILCDRSRLSLSLAWTGRGTMVNASLTRSLANLQKRGFDHPTQWKSAEAWGAMVGSPTSPGRNVHVTLRLGSEWNERGTDILDYQLRADILALLIPSNSSKNGEAGIIIVHLAQIKIQRCRDVHLLWSPRWLPDISGVQIVLCTPQAIDVAL